MESQAVAPATEPKDNKTMKLAFWRAVGFGAGFCLVLALLASVGVWYSLRPKPPKAWNESAIKARFTGLEFQRLGEDVEVRYKFGLKNTTLEDYLVPPSPVAQFGAKAPENGGTSILKDAQWDSVNIPPGQELNVEFKWKYKLSDYSSGQAVLKGTDKDAVEFMNNRMKDYQSFEFLDYSNHYRVLLPGVPNTSDKK